MAVSIAATTTGVIAHAVSVSTASAITHAAGTDFLVGIAWRSNTITISSVTYDGVAMDLVTASIQGGGNPGTTAAFYRMNDPGAKTADVVVTYSAAIAADCMYFIDVAGCPTTSPVDIAGSNQAASGTTASVTVNGRWLPTIRFSVVITSSASPIRRPLEPLLLCWPVRLNWERSSSLPTKAAGPEPIT